MARRRNDQLGLAPSESIPYIQGFAAAGGTRTRGRTGRREPCASCAMVATCSVGFNRLKRRPSERITPSRLMRVSRAEASRCTRHFAALDAVASRTPPGRTRSRSGPNRTMASGLMFARPRRRIRKPPRRPIPRTAGRIFQFAGDLHRDCVRVAGRDARGAEQAGRNR